MEEKIILYYCNSHPFIFLTECSLNGWHCPLDGSKMHEKSITPNGLLGWKKGAENHFREHGQILETCLPLLLQKESAYDMKTGQPLGSLERK